VWLCIAAPVRFAVGNFEVVARVELVVVRVVAQGFGFASYDCEMRGDINVCARMRKCGRSCR